PRRAPGAGVVAGARALDLDDLGAQVGERHGGQRARENPREVGHQDPVERTVGHRAATLPGHGEHPGDLRPASRRAYRRRTPARASWAASRLAGWLGEGRTAVAYPGLWLRDDVYATHGHLSDLYSTIPTFERFGAAITSRVVGGELPERATVDDFLCRLEPVY